MALEYKTFGPDGQCKLFGVNIFDYDCQTTGKRVKVKDPIYHQDHTFEVWQVEIDGQIHRRRGLYSLQPISETLHRLPGGLYCAAGLGEQAALGGGPLPGLGG